MREYPKIHAPFKRGDGGVFLDEWARPEFEYLQDVTWTATEKIDGMNMRLFCGGDHYVIAGRTDRAEIPPALREHMEALGERVAADLEGLTLYGEGYGAGIQKGGRYRPDQAFILFDALTSYGRWLSRGELAPLAQDYDIPVVFDMGTAPLNDWITWVKEGKSIPSVAAEGSWWPAEGVVLRTEVELHDARGERIITKLKSRDRWA